MEWGTVYIDRRVQRRWVSVSSRLFREEYASIILARASLHTTSGSNAKQYGSIALLPTSIPLGEAVILYGDPTEDSFFPMTGHFVASLAQGCILRVIREDQLENTAVYRRIDSIQESYRAPLTSCLRLALYGTTRLPKKFPTSLRPTLSNVRQGAILRITTTPTSAPFDALICTHDTVHAHYPVPAILYLPIHDRSSNDILKRYSFDQLSTLSAYQPPFQLEIIAHITSDELTEVLALFELILDGDP